MLRLRVIGTGSSGNCYLLTDVDSVTGQPRDALLLDAGVTPIQRISKAIYEARPAQVRGCLVTHEHGDHAAAVRSLSMMGIPCYGTPGTVEAVGQEMRPMHLYKPLEIGSFYVLAFPTNHNAREPCGFLINSLRTGERLIYATDTYYLSHRYPGVHYWLIECNYCQELVTDGAPPDLEHRHMSLDRLSGVFEANDLRACRKNILCHMSHERGDRERMVRTIHDVAHKAVIMAEPGQTYDLNLDPF